MNNKSFINSYKSNLDSSYSLNLRYNFYNRKVKNKEQKDNNLNQSNINVYNSSNLNMNTINSKGRKYKYFTKFSEKKISKEILNSSQSKKQNILSNANSSKLNQSSLEGFHFYKQKPSIKQEISEINNISKIKEENSDIPTCESSDSKPLNDFSIRKTYRNKKLKNEEKERKGFEKNKLYNKIKNTKISSEHNPCCRKIGVRKFYKQKNLEENK